MGKSSADIMEGFGWISWGIAYELKTATFRYKSTRFRKILNIIIDGIRFRFSDENWIYPNHLAYNHNQQCGVLRTIYGIMQENRDVPDKYRKMLNDFTSELNVLFTGDHTELQVTFMWRPPSEIQFVTSITGERWPMPDNSAYFYVVVPHTPSSSHTTLTKETHAPRSL